MRIIDADELVKQLKEDAENMQGLAFQMATSHLIGTIENQLTIMGMVAVDSVELEEKDERIAELEKKLKESEKQLEERENYIRFLREKNIRLVGIADALQFAIKADSVSGPEVNMKDYY